MREAEHAMQAISNFDPKKNKKTILSFVLHGAERASQPPPPIKSILVVCIARVRCEEQGVQAKKAPRNFVPGFWTYLPPPPPTLLWAVDRGLGRWPPLFFPIRVIFTEWAPPIARGGRCPGRADG